MSDILVIDGKTYEQASFAHYGVKGMRWGYRKAEVNKKLSSMSNDDISSAIKRLRLEQDFRQLSGVSKENAGLAWVRNNAAALSGIAASVSTVLALGIKVHQLARNVGVT